MLLLSLTICTVCLPLQSRDEIRERAEQINKIAQEFEQRWAIKWCLLPCWFQILIWIWRTVYPLITSLSFIPLPCFFLFASYSSLLPLLLPFPSLSPLIHSLPLSLFSSLIFSLSQSRWLTEQRNGGGDDALLPLARGRKADHETERLAATDPSNTTFHSD